VVLDYIRLRPDHLWSMPPKHEEPFSTPRSWHMLSDALKEYGEDVPDSTLEVLAYGCLSPAHAGQFKAFVKQARSKYRLTAILRGEMGWPHAGLIKSLAAISFEMAQMVVARQDGEGLPDWLLLEIVRDLPRLVERKDGA
jgi:hypothetical protein